MKRIAVLASGSGSNAQRLVEYFREHPRMRVSLIGCDKPGAGVLERAWRLGVPSYLFNGAALRDGTVVSELRASGAELVVLAGFLRLVPPAMVKAFPDRIVNIHPALLPQYGGKGMYGHHVHEAVVAAGEAESGITVHLVNERYDEGRQLFQARCPVLPTDDPAQLAARVLELEHAHFPRVVEEYLDGLPAFA